MCFAYFYAVSCFFFEVQSTENHFQASAFVSCLHLQGAGALPESGT